MSGLLALEDGSVFYGESVGADGLAAGEAVFTTGMSGYQEAVTDPSFAEQIVCFTAPMVGNYGVAESRNESSNVHAKAVLMREARGPEWTSWLRGHGVVALTGIDTRSLVLQLRERGAMRAVAVAGDVSADDAVAAARAQTPMAGRALAREVSTPELRFVGEEGRARIAVVDAGTLAGFDGVLLSPGPGDPEPLADEAATVGELLGRTNVLGICLGHQLLGVATGHQTFKLPFGHRGSNHPVLERASGQVLVTSQNHGFAVRAKDESDATHVSLYDHTVEGLAFPELRARSLQFHPEAGPGPHDAWPLLQRWVDEVAA
jgi:carbamoyl-phosphate synthase small subunit